MRTFLLTTMALWALGGTLDYDAISEPDGTVATPKQQYAARELATHSRQLESLYADAAAPNARAARICQQLEAWYSQMGRDDAEALARRGCFKGAWGLTTSCPVDWSHLDFLRADQPGGKRLRRAYGAGYAAGARSVGVERVKVLWRLLGLLGDPVAAEVLKEVEGAKADGGAPP